MRIVVVGSGASGVHFALTVARKGHDVLMLDVGLEKPPAVNPGDSFNELKERLADPVEYFLGEQFEGVVHESSSSQFYTKYYGFPPSKSYVFAQPTPFAYDAQAFEPLVSFARGGLAEAWTGGAYALNDDELGDFPFGYAAMEAAYDEVARRIGLAGAADDLARYFPVHKHLLAPLRLDEGSERILAAYARSKDRLYARYRARLGRSRVTTISQGGNGRPECSYCGRCLWGCPSGALYTPSATLDECLRYPNLTYVPGQYVRHFDAGADGRIRSVAAETVGTREAREFSGDTYVLAGGTLSSSRIFMETVRRRTGRIPTLTGLMDNRQILVPFTCLAMFGKRYRPDSYQYHLLAVGIEADRPEEYVHGQITTLKGTFVHPFIQKVPLDLKTAAILFRNLRASLGIVNVNLHDRRRDSSFLTLAPSDDGASKLVIHYEPTPGEPAAIARAIATVTGVMRGVGCWVLPWLIHVRPMGASVHYSGTLPMRRDPAPLTVSPRCQSHDFPNLYVVDGTTMPFLPAKNITLTLMANAVRVAEAAF